MSARSELESIKAELASIINELEAQRFSRGWKRVLRTGS